MHEVPVNATQSGGGSIGHKYELTESTNVIPKMYEYATLEPNETMVINFLILQGNCQLILLKNVSKQ